MPNDEVTVQERWTERSGVRIRFLDSAPAAPEGLPILFSPGYVDDADEYREMLAFFAPRRVVVVDVRGRGKSDAPPTGYSLDHHTDDFEAAADEAGLDRYHLMTFSRGTPTAMTLALRHPERVASLSIGDYPAEEIPLGGAFADQSWAHRFRGKPMPERVAKHVLVGIAAESKTQELWQPVADLGVPVLVVHGTEAGVVIRPEDVQRYRELIPHVEVVILEGAPHDLFRPNRNAYPAAVADFVARRTPGL